MAGNEGKSLSCSFPWVGAGASCLHPLLTALEGPLGGSSKDLHQFVVPRDHVALKMGGAVGQALDLCGRQDVVP